MNFRHHEDGCLLPGSSCPAYRGCEQLSVFWPSFEAVGLPELTLKGGRGMYLHANTFAYLHNRTLRELLTSRGIRHLTTQCGALPPDNGARMGQRARLPDASTPATPPGHTGSTTTTGDGHTARSATGEPSAAFTTSVG
jgi:hypothetical protein